MTIKRLPPLNTLRGFEAAGRLCSFHQAAAELHLTQSAISQQIRSLEAHLEQALFVRSGRRVSLTDAGRDLLSTTQLLMQQFAAGIRRLDQYRKPNQLVLSTSPAFARHWLLPRLGDFHRQHPKVDLWLLTTDEPPEMASQAIDIAIREDISAQVGCSFRELHSDRLFPACQPLLLSVSPGDRMTLHGERYMDWSHWEVESGVDVGQRSNGLNFSDPGLLLDAACAGLGIALVSELLSRDARAAGLLVPLAAGSVRGPTWSCLVDRNSEASSLALGFCDWLQAQLGEA